jgi:hypothetical protein
MTKYNPIIQQNASWLITLTLKNAAGVAMDLEHWTGQSQIKSVYSGTVLASPTVAITSPTEGVVTVSLTAVQTAEKIFWKTGKLNEKNLNGEYFACVVKC